ncbi:MAG TPA: PilT/PilU family type 4a pilus ATPase [Verrucomicrobiae bacterium]|jgi:twitching motility protein PilT|nr:PilT/PilU family type 4a pilus ATPase [Verrucomicrobiae bacterium]
MDLHSLIGMAKANGASDLHLEPGLPAAIRVRGTLRASGAPIPGKVLLEAAHELIGPEEWPHFLERQSYDLSRSVSGVRCRINVLQTSRGIGLAIRLLIGFQATVEKLNLHPDLKKLIGHSNGLIIISGATGSGKSSTLAALIQEINLTETRHIVTIESPIEYVFKPHRAYIRQREVGRDTPSFEQALMDAMREDPDVLMVGEMRDPETMRLTLNAAETGHLVLATAHSATAAEALQRVVSAFPSEIQNSVCAQLADCIVAVISQRLQYRTDLKMQVPECEILMSGHAVKNFIRRGEFFKLTSAMETGANEGMWTYSRYRTWLEARKTWHFPGDQGTEEPTADLTTTEEVTPLPRPSRTSTTPSARPNKVPSTSAGVTSGGASGKNRDDLLEIEPEAGGLEAIISKLKSKP